MPWTLTTPISTGDLDAGTYSEVKIIEQTHEQGRVACALQYGNTVADQWVRGVAPPSGKATSVEITEAEYTDIVTNSVPDVQTSDPSDANYVQVGAVWVERTYVATKRGLYEWLAANGHIEAGSVT